MNRAIPRLMAWTAAIALAAATRAPRANSEATAIALAAAAIIVAMPYMLLWRKVPRSLRAWTFLGSIAFIILPPSRQAILQVPPWTVALAMAIAWHVYFQDDARRAPVVASGHQWGRHHIARFFPAIIAIAALVLLPLAMQSLPLRIRAAYEMQGAFVPLAAAILLAGLLVLVGSIRTVIRDRFAIADAREVHEKEAEPA